MKILYDHQTFTGSLYGGVSRYFADLMNVYINDVENSFELSLKFSNNEYLRGVSYAAPVSFRALAKNFRVNQAASLLNRLYSGSRIAKGNFDVFHPTYYHPYFLDKIGKKPVVITFHDTMSEQFGHQYPELGEGLTDRKKRCIDRADAIIAISEATKRELLHWFDVDERKVHVVYHGNPISEALLIDYTPKLSLPPRFVLFVGARKFYKNFNRFFEAIAPILQKDSDLHLVCAGNGDFDTSEREMIVKHKLSAQVHHQPIANDNTFVELYKKASVFAFPSLLEGFGFPILEAMSCGCPVVASSGTCFDEIALEAAQYFDPNQTDSIKTTLENVLYNESLQNRMSQAGKVRAKDFNKEKMAAETLSVYKKCVMMNA